MKIGLRVSLKLFFNKVNEIFATKAGRHEEVIKCLVTLFPVATWISGNFAN
ncbi:hypothetical protein BH11BAC1_BH11BAC1_18510 [soil metagenome]